MACHATKKKKNAGEGEKRKLSRDVYFQKPLRHKNKLKEENYHQIMTEQRRYLIGSHPTTMEVEKSTSRQNQNNHILFSRRYYSSKMDIRSWRGVSSDLEDFLVRAKLKLR